MQNPRSTSPTLLPILTILQWAVLVLIAASLLTQFWYAYLWMTWGLIALAFVIWWPDLRSGARRWWFAYVVGILIYTLLRSYADDAGFPIQVTYTIEVDRWLFRGTDPVVWLQSTIFRPPGVGVVDIFATQIHWSFFIVPHATALAIYVWQRELFWRYVTSILAIKYIALIFFFLLPTAPPWLAARYGELDYVYRVMHFVGRSVDVETYRSLYTSLGEPNSVAAMPSIHMAITLCVFLWARRYVPRVAPYLLVYSVLMALALMYLAEHYLLDLAVGAAIAVVVDLALARRFDRPLTERVLEMGGRASEAPSMVSPARNPSGPTQPT